MLKHRKHEMNPERTDTLIKGGNYVDVDGLNTLEYTF